MEILEKGADTLTVKLTLAEVISLAEGDYRETTCEADMIPVGGEGGVDGLVTVDGGEYCIDCWNAGLVYHRTRARND